MTVGYKRAAKTKQGRGLGFNLLRLRYLSGATEDVFLAATAQNLKRPAEPIPACPPSGQSETSPRSLGPIEQRA